jgi:hypothetical protein
MEQRQKFLYVLNDAGEPKQVTDLAVWAEWFEANKFNRQVGDDCVGDTRVSTIFLAIDEAFGDVPPLLYETTVFGGPLDQQHEKYHTKADATAGHARWLERVSAAAATMSEQT